MAVLPRHDRGLLAGGQWQLRVGVLRKRFWRFWLGAPLGDVLFMLGAAGQRKSVSLEITGLGALAQRAS